MAIDVKPGFDPNLIHVRSRGVTPVAILGRDDLDAREIDPTSLRFGDGCATPLGDGIVTDVDSDGHRDLLVEFRTSEAGIRCGDTLVAVTGSMRDGPPIHGADSIATAGCLRGGNRGTGAPISPVVPAIRAGTD